MCAGTIVGLTSYASIYDGAVCLDGAYQFRYRYLPDDCFCIDIPLSPIALTIPPTIIRPYLVAQGRDKVRFVKKPQAEYDELSPTFVAMMFVIHSQVIPDPKWNNHIRDMVV